MLYQLSYSRLTALMPSKVNLEWHLGVSGGGDWI